MATEEPEMVSEFEGYSDYRFVSVRMTKSIDSAIDAYASIRSLHQQGAKVKDERAAQAQQRILGAAMRVLVEIENQDESDDRFDEIEERWTEGTDEHDDGLIKLLQETDLVATCPPWLFTLVKDIRTAGWKLGYLRAGRSESKPKNSTPETEARQMFEDL